MASVAEIRAIASKLSCHAAILAGDVHDKCVPFSRELKNELMDRGIPTIMVGGDAATGKIKHNYLFVQTDEGIRLVDPTAGQFIPTLKGEVYIGTREDLLSRGTQQNSDTNWDEVWSAQPLLWKRGGENYEGAKLSRFYAEWGSTGTQAVTSRSAARPVR